MTIVPNVSFDVLRLDAERAVNTITAVVRHQVLRQFRKRGVVVGLSGGIDSSVVAALCARAVGKDRVLALLMPERESSGDSSALGQLVAEDLGVRFEVHDITSILDAAGCYERR